MLQAPPADRLARLLVQRGCITEAELARARRLGAARGAPEPLARLLVRLGLAAERDVAAALAELTGVPLAAASDYPAGAADAPAAALRLPPRFLRESLVLPLGEDGEGVHLAMADPADDGAARAVALACGRPVVRRVGTPSEIEAAIERLGGGSSMARIAGEAGDAGPAAGDEDLEHLRELAGEAPAIRLASLILQRAVDCNASDVHIEPFASRLRVRYRVDGVLHDAEAPPQHLGAALVSRIKVMAKLDVAEKRLPQDGRFVLRTQGRSLDVRVSTVPALHGEGLVLRLLNRQAVALDFRALGFLEDDVQRLQALLERPHGMLLVTGPTGSGKTTTLYAALARLNVPARKVITVEDPVEYELEGASQIPVRPAIGLGFANALRAIVRQDPDVIMVGEMRDLDTARICVQSALTGHLVLSTLHTNDAAGSVTRLLDMGIEDYLITSTVNAVLGQRLVRRLCEDCRRPHRPDRALLERTGLARLRERLADGAAVTLYQPAGCPRCAGTGYRGQCALAELMVMSDALRRLVLEHADAATLGRAAREAGMRTLYEDGLRKVLAGLTSIDEVLRVAAER